MNTWRAGCSGSCTSGSEGGPQKPTRRKPDRALRSDPYTYVPTWAGMAYVCFIVDAFSRTIVGWRVASNMRTDMVLDAIEMARWQRGTTLAGLRSTRQRELTGNKTSEPPPDPVGFSIVGCEWGWIMKQKHVNGVTALWPNALPDHVSAAGNHGQQVAVVAECLRSWLRPGS